MKEGKNMFKNILKCSIFALMAITTVACHQDDHRHRGDGNGASCYRNGHSSVYCHRN
ncbi:MAG: hypothetical protein K0R48_1286 [Gammaproteobacteria bacterium]|nr:hypothetical protein [Gammaproteobacteria bacterium]